MWSERAKMSDVINMNYVNIMKKTEQNMFRSSQRSNVQIMSKKHLR